MASALSTYWVRFFKNAGFPQDVATKHAVVFSNNRIKPDMLPDLDKPSLKEMGITLMGDMIAILRYAKRVVEETTCEKFLVDTEDSQVPTRTVVKPVVKKVVGKVAPKSTVLSKVKPVTTAKSVTTTSSSIVKKKVASNITKPVDKEEKKPVKRKFEKKIEILDSDSEDEWKNESQKRLKAAKDDVEYKVIMPKGTTVRSQQILKKAVDQKLTVFDRLGDSSVTSTTNLAESTTTFNITGLGKDVIKRNSSVFNRLGGKDLLKKNEASSPATVKNGSSAKPTQGILKTRVPTKTTTIISLNKESKSIVKPKGTMRADRETHVKTASNSVKRLIKNTKYININEESPKPVKSITTKSKLASERVMAIPAKARLGVPGSPPKQVTFNSFASVASAKKPGVFSRLGI